MRYCSDARSQHACLPVHEPAFGVLSAEIPLEFWPQENRLFELYEQADGDQRLKKMSEQIWITLWVRRKAKLVPDSSTIKASWHSWEVR